MSRGRGQAFASRGCTRTEPGFASPSRTRTRPRTRTGRLAHGRSNLCSARIHATRDREDRLWIGRPRQCCLRSSGPGGARTASATTSSFCSATRRPWCCPTPGGAARVVAVPGVAGARGDQHGGRREGGELRLAEPRADRVGEAGAAHERVRGRGSVLARARGRAVLAVLRARRRRRTSRTGRRRRPSTPSRSRWPKRSDDRALLRKTMRVTNASGTRVRHRRRARGAALPGRAHLEGSRRGGQRARRRGRASSRATASPTGAPRPGATTPGWCRSGSPGTFSPSPATIIVVPFRPGPEAELGPIVNDQYFGQRAGRPPGDQGERDLLPRRRPAARQDRRLAPRARARSWAATTPRGRVLTLVTYTLPEGATDYVNSLWEQQREPYRGDAINSYNDGPPAPGREAARPVLRARVVVAGRRAGPRRLGRTRAPHAALRRRARGSRRDRARRAGRRHRRHHVRVFARHAMTSDDLTFVDAHVHFWDGARIAYPWLAEVPAIAGPAHARGAREPRRARACRARSCSWRRGPMARTRATKSAGSTSWRRAKTIARDPGRVPPPATDSARRSRAPSTRSHRRHRRAGGRRPRRRDRSGAGGAARARARARHSPPHSGAPRARLLRAPGVRQPACGAWVSRDGASICASGTRSCRRASSWCARARGRRSCSITRASRTSGAACSIPGARTSRSWRACPTSCASCRGW